MDEAGNVFATGRWYDSSSSDDILTMKFRGVDGATLWQVYDDGAAGLADRGWSIVVGPQGHPVVTGIHSAVTDPADYRTIQYDSANGSVRWSRTEPGAVNSLTRKAGWLAVMDGGDVVMGNRTFEAATSFDVVLRRYAGANGATVWQTRYNSGGNTQDDPVHMVRDASGNLLLAGIRVGNFMVCKFDGGDGSLLWSVDHDGPGGGYDAAAAVAEGAPGEVIVSGFGTGTDSGWDVMTTGFGSADGVLRWEQCFGLVGSLSDEGASVALGGLGDLYVTGYSERTTIDTDLVTLRYDLSGSTGAPPVPAPAGPGLVVFPNPGSRCIRLTVESTGAEPVRVTVHDVQGRRLAHLHAGLLPAGRHRFTWSGEHSLPPSPGVYFVTVESQGRRVSRKAVLLP